MGVEVGRDGAGENPRTHPCRNRKDGAPGTAKAKVKCPTRETGAWGTRRDRSRTTLIYTLKELPQPQVLLTLGLLNLKPAPSSVST